MYTLSRDGWREPTEAMHGEDDGSWILIRDYMDRSMSDDCVAIMTPSVGSLIIFVTRLAEILHPGDPGMALQTVRYLADRGTVVKERNSTPIYYFRDVAYRRDL